MFVLSCCALLFVPQNNKVCRLCDYGVSKLMVKHGGPSSSGIGARTEGRTHTQTMGTPDYMPPEVMHRTELVEGRRTLLRLRSLITHLLHSLRVALHCCNLLVFCYRIARGGTAAGASW